MNPSFWLYSNMFKNQRSFNGNPSTDSLFIETLIIQKVLRKNNLQMNAIRKDSIYLILLGFF